MKLSYEYEDKIIEFTVVFRKRRTMSIQVVPPNIVTVIAPLKTHEDRIIEVVKTKSKWILKKLTEMKELEYEKKEPQYINGEEFLYMGDSYSLEIVVSSNNKRPEVRLINKTIYVHCNTVEKETIKKALKEWYKARATEKINERIEHYQPYFNVKPNVVKVKEQQKRWGSCSSKGTLLFNWRCIMAPLSVLDYVVVHEMSHLIHMNHSKDYWSLVKQVLPDYEEAKAWLNKNGIRISL